MRTFTWEREAIRFGAWNGRGDRCYVALAGTTPQPSVQCISQLLDKLRAEGFRHAVTAALREEETSVFRSVGFQLHERLLVFAHSLADISKPTHRTRRVSRGRIDQILAVDKQCFQPFWQLDRVSLNDALHATEHVRFRTIGSPPALGYAVTGMSGTTGYLQRLGVAPSAQNQGVGTALIQDCLAWLKGRHATQAIVNTQMSNVKAQRLYQHNGFSHRLDDLVVLEVDLTS